MPGFDGFSVVKGVMEIDPPLFVFVTAYSEHALKAFEANAVDYLLKPVDQDRLADALDRARTRLLEKRGLEEVEKLCREIAIVNKGRVVRQGSKDEIAGAPGGLEDAYLAATGSQAEHVAAK